MNENKRFKKHKTRRESYEELEAYSKSKRPKTTENANQNKTAKNTMMAWDLASPHSDSSDDEEERTTDAQPSTSQNSLLDQTGAEIDCTEELEQIEDILDEGNEKTFSTAVDDSIAFPWEDVTNFGLTVTQRKDFNQNNPIAVNLSMLKAPAINPELTKLLSEKVMKRDKVLQSHQALLGQATASLGVAIDKLIKTNGSTDVIYALKETGKQLCDLFNKKTNARRFFIVHAVDKETSHLVKAHKADRKFLFGEKLTDDLDLCKALINSLSKDKIPKPPKAKPKVPKTKPVYHARPQFVTPPLAPPGIRPHHPAPDHPPLPRAPGSRPSFRPRGQGPRHRAPGPREAPRGYHHQFYRPRRGNPRGHYHN